MGRCLIIFIDGLPHYELENTATLRRFPAVSAMQPSFGFSPNIYAELYAGKNADDVGFFNEWSRDPEVADDPANIWMGRLAPALDLTRATGITSTLAHRFVGKFAGRHIANIPFRYQRWFSHKSVKVYSDKFPHETLFQRHDFDVVTAEQFRGIGKRDERAFAAALQAIDGGKNVYVSMVDYDNQCHRYGVNSHVVHELLGRIDHWVQLLQDTFLAKHPDGSVFVVSDHGMVDVAEGYDLPIEAAFGPAHPDRYLYFPDSAMCRIWCADEVLRGEIAAWFDSLGNGQVLTEDERARWGLRSRDFGDMMFVLDPPICFQQNFHAWRLPRAMHGYHPRHYSQWGIFLARIAHGLQTNTVVSPLDVYDVFERHLAGTNEEG